MEPLLLDKSDAVGQLAEAFNTPNAEQNCSAPGAFFGKFVLPEGQNTLDNFLDPTGWGKGVAFVNNFNLGRYWPSIGPQVFARIITDLLVSAFLTASSATPGNFGPAGNGSEPCVFLLPVTHAAGP
ncbi:hypothetical protein HPB51_004541 [Rhipicephalus microplus]|uniref:Beta-galactosidase galactose-binding domain-containing protein n=1 Tax=Rhipicephalus microplus TaxID=6941 RepID=A0A9J6EMD2_RHIMP|nr:hypothetical protein HPB51_004541 [Rhipicephalus microplus]